jgi:hypothetical protein
MSCSVIVLSRNYGRDRMSVSRFFTNTTLPAPIMAIRGTIRPFDYFKPVLAIP